MPNYSGIWTEQAVMQANGAGNWPNAPGAPTIGTATDTTNGGSVSVAFTAPTFAGLPAVITSYTVTSSPGGVTGTGASSPITVSGLTNGTAYTFTVTATNASGTSAASAASNSVTPTLVVYIEQTFSTYLYTGNGTSQTITNGIDLSTNGGLVWTKRRNVGQSHALYDTVRGIDYYLSTNSTTFSAYSPGDVTSFNSNGFSLGSGTTPNTSGGTYASWTFRKQPKFFDVVTYSGNSTAGREISHNLGSVPGCIIVKSTSAAGSWWVFHRSLGATQRIALEDTAAAATNINPWYNTTPTSTVFTLSAGGAGNDTGTTYVAYLFAHDAGGFGLSGTDNVISCGSFTSNSSGGISPVNLGYEPQWLLVKNTSSDGWRIQDVMRGWSQTQLQDLCPNNSDVERVLNNNPSYLSPTATGFSTPTEGIFTPNNTFIYIAIRRGPMKIPTVGTNVFSIVSRTGTATTAIVTGAVSPPDLVLTKSYTNAAETQSSWYDRLRGIINPILSPRYTLAEFGGTNPVVSYNMDGVTLNDSNSWGVNINGVPLINYFIQRNPSYFDEVCYTGNGTTQNITHNLTVVPELLIVKRRSGGSGGWPALVTNINKYGFLDGTFAFFNAAPEINLFGNNTNYVPPTSSAITVGLNTDVNAVSSTYVAYLFATCAGVSKVGSYTGTGATQTINCGFTGGARFVLIKRTDSTGDWYYWDTTRGMVSGTNPYLVFNTSAAQVNANSVFTIATGFQVVSTAAGINASGGTYIFLAIA